MKRGYTCPYAPRPVEVSDSAVELAQPVGDWIQLYLDGRTPSSGAIPPELGRPV